MAGVATWSLPNFTAQDPTTYRATIDADFQVAAAIADAFATHAQATPDMTVAVDGGILSGVGKAPLAVAAQTSPAMTAPAVALRNDLVCIDATSGALVISAGQEGATPADPAVPTGKIAVARVRHAVGETAIQNAAIDDLRAPGFLGAEGTAGASAALLAAAYGAASSLATTSGTMSAGATLLTLASAADFANGQGVAVYHAGPGPYQTGTTTTLATPAAPSVAVTGASGATSYTYGVRALDAAGGVTAASAGTAIANGNATLSSADYNALSVTATPGARGYAWYRDGVLIAVTDDPAYDDTGAAFAAVGMQAEIVPASSAGGPYGQTLLATIQAGGGTTTLTLDAAATNAVSDAAVHHDNSQAINAAIAAAAALIAAGDTKSEVRLIVEQGQFPCAGQIAIQAGVTLETRGVLYNELADKYTALVAAAPGSHVALLKIWNNLLSGVTLGTAGVESDMRIGRIRLWNTGNQANADSSLQQWGVRVAGYDFKAVSIQVDGGNIGLDLYGCSDVWIGSYLGAINATALRVGAGCEQIFLPSVQLDSPYYAALQIDSSDGVQIKGRAFTNNQNNANALSSGYAAIIGKYSSANPVHALDLDLEIDNTGGTGVYLGYLDLSPNIRLNIANGTLGTGNATPIANGIEYGAGVGANVAIRGGIAVSGAALVGTPVGIYDLLIGGAMQSNRAAVSFANPGYIRHANGLIEQWGTATTGSGGSVAVTFAMPFPNQILAMVASANTNGSVDFVAASGLSLHGANLDAWNSGGYAAAGVPVSWIAMGR